MPQIAVTEKLTANLTDQEWLQLQVVICSGRTIEAIKQVREILPEASLAEAKGYVTKIEADLRASAPERFSAPASPGSKAGWVVAAILLAVIAGTVLMVLSRK
jgi:hypothetical protein